MTDLEKQMADALTECKRLADACPELNLSNYDPDDVDALNAWAIEVAQAIDALHDAQAAEQAAGGGEAVPYCHIYEYDLPLGLHRALYPKQWNGSLPNRTVPVYTHPAPAAPSDPQPRGAEPQVWLYDFMDGATTVRNWSTTNKAEAFAPGNFNQRGYVPAEN